MVCLMSGPTLSAVETRWRASPRSAVSSLPCLGRCADAYGELYNDVPYAGLTLDQILELNPEVKPNEAVKDGQTILLPANKLSSRDKEILGGIGTTYRLYPIRAGETLSEVLSKRKISEAEILSLNPGLDLKHVKGTLGLRLYGEPPCRERDGLGLRRSRARHLGERAVGGGGWVVWCAVP